MALRVSIQMARKRKTLMSQEPYDVVIVGAGAAGCVVASYLAERADASIALIEAGDMDRDPFIHIPAGFANMLARDRDHDDDQRDEEQGLVRKWSAKGERHKPSYRSVTPLDARRLPRSN